MSPIHHASLSRDCVVIGANTRVEIWDLPAWDAYLAACEPAFSERSTEVVPGLF